MSTTLVLGGVRGGKSRHAEGLMGSYQTVVYIATGPVAGPDDPEWQQRIILHQDRRPEGWQTWETVDLSHALLRARCPVLVDDLGNWVSGQIDAIDAWKDRERATAHLDTLLDELVVALAAIPYPVVVVSNEVGMGVVPKSASGRLYRDLLGIANARVSAIATAVHVVIAGRVLDLSNAPLVR